MYVCPYVRLPLVGAQPLLGGLQTPLIGIQTSPAGPQNPLTGPWMDKWMDRRMDGWRDGISPHSTGLCPLSGPLPCYPLRLQNNKEAGQGNR